MLLWTILLGLVHIGICGGELCHSVSDCHATNCKDFHHDGWTLVCESHTCKCTAPKTACDSHPCLHGGVCGVVHTGSGFKCFCRHGFSGDMCQIYSHCGSSPCQNNGTCYDSSHNPYYRCSCSSGYQGPRCQHTMTTAASVCDSRPCYHNGVCKPASNSVGYTCDCPHGYSGQRCELHSHCGSYTCQNNGTCYDSPHSPYYRCSCSSGYQGPRCQHTMTTAASVCDSRPCYHNGVCKPASNSVGYTCDCPHGYSGQRCEQNTYCNSNPCKNNGSCRPRYMQPYYSCTCPSGYYGSTCQYIDQCAAKPCPHGWSCQRFYSTHRCTCINQQYCKNNQHEVDHCASQPCQHYGKCMNTTVSPYFRCDCQYSFSGQTCQVNNNCQHQPCRNNGTCYTANRLPFFTCKCNNGYYGSSCEHYDHCTSSPCPNGTICHRTSYGNGYHCKCATNANCATGNKCATHPCHNNGQCAPTTTAPYYHCTCPAGFAGANCEYDACSKQNNCVHGTCLRTTSSPYYTCNCQHGFHGYRCEFESCPTGKCHNGATCRPLTHNPYFTCACLQGYKGGLCQNRIVTHTQGTTAKPVTPQPHTTIKPTPKPHTTIKPTPRTTTVPVPHGPTCLSCTDVVSPQTCEYITHCGVHEKCYVDEYVNSIGSIRYDLGCRDNLQCDFARASVGSKRASTTAEDESHLLTCTECCVNGLCNSGGCGKPAFPALSSGLRGPICFHCDQQNSPDDCSKIKTCGRDEDCEYSPATCKYCHGRFQSANEAVRHQISVNPKRLIFLIMHNQGKKQNKTSFSRTFKIAGDNVNGSTAHINSVKLDNISGKLQVQTTTATHSQVCMLNTTSVGTSHQTLWKSDCQPNSICQQKSLQTDAVHLVKGHCQNACCSGDLCNNAC